MKIILLILLSGLIYAVNSVSIYSWTVTGRKTCGQNATQQQTQALINCDKLMRPERKQLLEICLKEVINNANYKLPNDKPMICTYTQNEQDFKVMDCMFNKTGKIYGKKFMANNVDEDFDAIDAVENDFEWCVMKAVSVYGFEHLCDMKLNQNHINAIEKCNQNSTELLKVLNDCRSAAKLKIDNKPSTCDFYGNIQVLNCYNQVSLKWTEHDQNNKWNQYIECLDDIKI
ncbi:uncharacterized protein LOC128963999 [Oppia nitens]|uniref:uncharacterized protein LOC128963999 n=1 Tax=Oppia nitens TaxID=1686743 RepID=UPI0023DBC676|nr:uncharacterized protein LOC128963999 [Oppia nitens]